jgi:hypothetical protein
MNIKNLAVHLVKTRVLVPHHPVIALIITLIASNIAEIIAYYDLSTESDVDYFLVFARSIWIILFAFLDVLFKKLNKIDKIRFDFNQSSHVHILTILFIVNIVASSILWIFGSPFIYIIGLCIQFSFSGEISINYLLRFLVMILITMTSLLYLHVSIMAQKT